MVKAEPSTYEGTPKKRLKCDETMKEDPNHLAFAQMASNTSSKCSQTEQIKIYNRKKPFNKACRSSCVAKDSQVSISNPKRPASEINKRRDLSNRVYASDEARMSAKDRARELEANLVNGFPSFVKPMRQSHVTGGFWLGLPTYFCKKNLPEQDATITLLDSSGKEWPVVYLAHKSGLSGGWRGFSLAHKLVDGDALVFELIKPKEFKVYIIRAYNLDATEGDMKLTVWNSSSNLKDQSKQIQTIGETANLQPSMEEISRNYNEGLMGLLAWNSSPNRTSQSKHMETNGEIAVLQPSLEETFRNDSEEEGGLEALKGIRFSETTVEFKDVKDLESFNIVVDGLIIDSEFSVNERAKYYELCRSQSAYLHENLLEGMNLTLVAGIILETLQIAYAIKTSKLTTSQGDFAAWGKSLGALEKLGINVGFLRARLQQLKSIAFESEKKFECRHDLKFQSVVNAPW